MYLRDPGAHAAPELATMEQNEPLCFRASVGPSPVCKLQQIEHRMPWIGEVILCLRNESGAIQEDVVRRQGFLPCEHVPVSSAVSCVVALETQVPSIGQGGWELKELGRTPLVIPADDLRDETSDTKL